MSHLILVVLLISSGGCKQSPDLLLNTVDQSIVDETPPEATTLRVTVVALPVGPVVDLTKPLPPLPDMTVEIKELQLKGTTNSSGTITFTVPLGTVDWYGPGASILEIEVWSPDRPFRTGVRVLITPQTNQITIPYSMIRNVFIDQVPGRRAGREASPSLGHLNFSIVGT